MASHCEIGEVIGVADAVGLACSRTSCQQCSECGVRLCESHSTRFTRLQYAHPALPGRSYFSQLAHVDCDSGKLQQTRTCSECAACSDVFPRAGDALFRQHGMLSAHIPYIKGILIELAGYRSPLTTTADFAYVHLHGPGPGKYQETYNTGRLGGWSKQIEDWAKDLAAVYI